MPHTLKSRPGAGKHRVLLAPDTFKGTFSAHQVAASLADGARQAGAVPDLCPLADEGTLAVLHDHLGGQLVRAPVHDPLGRTIRASYLRIDTETAVIESALASGLGLLAGESGFAERASSYGTGQQLAAAASAGARRIIVTGGGTATTDGGAGALAAIANGGLRDARIDVLCDVTVPFEKVAAVFGPQKGAAPAQVAVLTERLHHAATQLGKDPRGVPRTGCAGGLSGALWANHGAALVSNPDYVRDTVGFDERALDAHLIITGEGAVDPQTLQGKLVHTVTARAQRLARPCAVVAGQVNLPDVASQLAVIAATPAQSLSQITVAAQDICTKALP